MTQDVPSPSSNPDRTSLELRRHLLATPARVFEAWTTPGLMGQWMSPVGVAEAEVDLRVGGRFRLVMKGHGVTIEHTGEYLEVDSPHRLKFTWHSPFTGTEPSVVTVVLEPDGNGTQLVLVHEHVPVEAADSHGSGWGTMLGRLARTLHDQARATNGGIK